MKSAFSVPGLLLVSLALGAGCGTPPPAIVEPPAEDAGAASAADKKEEARAAEPVKPAMAADQTPAVVAAPAEPIVDPAQLGIFKYMPAECDEGRVYANTGKVLEAKGGAALDALIVNGMSRKDAKKGEKVVKILKAGGIEPVKGTSEIAACVSADQNKVVVAVTLDLSKAKKPAETIAKAIEAGDEKAPKVEVEGDVTYLTSTTGTDVLAVVGKTTLLFGKDRALLAASVKGGNGVGFASAVGKVVWARVKDKRTEVDATEAGDGYELRVSFEDRKAERMKAEFDKVLPELDGLVGRMPANAQKIILPLLPAAKNAKLQVQGTKLVATTRFPKSAVGEALTAAGKLKPEELQKAFDL